MKGQGARIACTTNSFAHPKANLCERLEAHPLVSHIQILLPSNTAPSSRLLFALNSCLRPDHFFIIRRSLVSIVQALVNLRRAAGSNFRFQGLSLSPTMEPIAFTPDGTLHINTNRMHELGLPGRRSATGKGYTIEIPLMNPELDLDDKFYRKVVSSLARHFPCVDLAYSLCIGGVSQPLEVEGMITPKVLIQVDISVEGGIPMPILTDVVIDSDVAELQSVFETFGLLACSVGNRVHTELHPSVSYVSAQWRGFMSCQQVQQILKLAQEEMTIGRIPWVAVQVWGWAHSPVSWLEQVAHDTSNSRAGESYYMILLLPGGHFCLLCGFGAHEHEL